jgi:membrane protein DedA with SNARE-associated domain
MEEILRLLQQYGFWLIFSGVFLESLGLPIPSAPILITAGAAAHFGILNFPLLILIAFAGMQIGDFLLFLAGRYTGWAILGLVCRLSTSPENCIFKSAESFYKRGKTAIVLSKFFPGMGMMTSPLAGSLNMRSSHFLAFDALGSLLYISLYSGFGYVFSHLVAQVIDGFYSLKKGFLLLLLAGLVLYFFYRVRQYRKFRLYHKGPRVSVAELAEKMKSPDWLEKILLVDVRSHGYYDPKARRIKGSIRIEPNNILAEMHRLPKEKEIYLYCT